MAAVSFFARVAPPPRVPNAGLGRRVPHESRRAMVFARRGWGDTDSRFSKLDKKGDGDTSEKPERDDYGDTQRNISFQELRKRQDREQRKVRLDGHQGGTRRRRVRES